MEAKNLKNLELIKHGSYKLKKHGMNVIIRKLQNKKHGINIIWKLQIKKHGNKKTTVPK